MNENVIQFGKSVSSDQKTAWLDQVAQAYDKATAALGHEPGALIFVAIDREGITSSWDMHGAWREYPVSATLLYAANHLRREADGDRR